MVKNYKKELDQQLARKEQKPQDLLDNYEFDQKTVIQNKGTQSFPINNPGRFLRDIDYDKALQKFLINDQFIDKNYSKERYDDEVFKRRNLRTKLVGFVY